MLRIKNEYQDFKFDLSSLYFYYHHEQYSTSTTFIMIMMTKSQADITWIYILFMYLCLWKSGQLMHLLYTHINVRNNWFGKQIQFWWILQRLYSCFEMMLKSSVVLAQLANYTINMSFVLGWCVNFNFWITRYKLVKSLVKLYQDVLKNLKIPLLGTTFFKFLYLSYLKWSIHFFNNF